MEQLKTIVRTLRLWENLILSVQQYSLAQSYVLQLLILILHLLQGVFYIFLPITSDKTKPDLADQVLQKHVLLRNLNESFYRGPAFIFFL